MRKILIAALISLATPTPAAADTGVNPPPAAQARKIVEAMPEFHLKSMAEDTHPLIRITPLKPWLLHLDGDAGSIAVDADSAGLRAVRYGDRAIALLSSRTGAAHVTVKGRDGKILMSRSVLVPETRQKYVRVVTGCGDKGGACGAPRIFYCPNLCYETHLARAGLD